MIDKLAVGWSGVETKRLLRSEEWHVHCSVDPSSGPFDREFCPKMAKP